MNSDHATKPDKPGVTVRRRPSDFSPAQPGVLMQAGCTSTCCCCLHLMGALAGAAVGLARPYNSSGPRPHQVIRRHVATAMVLGLVLPFLFIGAFVGLSFLRSSASRYHEDPVAEVATQVFVALALAPPVALLPMSVGVLIAAVIAKHKLGHSNDPETVQQIKAGMKLAYGIAWMPLVFSTVGTVVGHLVMLPFWLTM